MKFKNPIIPGFHPDPSVCRVGDDYYLVTSSFEYFPGVPIFKSKDLINWTQIGHCLTRKSQLDLMGVSASDGIYAPTIRYHNGRFYMTTTNISRTGNFIVWADDPAGEWSDPIVIDHHGIDPSLFFDDDGKVYYTGTGFDEGYGIYVFEVDIETGEKLTKPKPIWSGTGGSSPEGPHIYKINGYYYLMISEGGTEYEHMVTIARGTSPMGPFTPCPRNPIISNRSLNFPPKAVGHADMFQAHDGSWWAVCLGIRPISFPARHNLGRETMLTPVKWGEDGWPIVGENGAIFLEMEADLLPQFPVAPKPIRDDFNDTKLDFCWNFLRNPNDEDWSLTSRPGYVTLNGSELTVDDVASPAFIGRRQEHVDMSVKTLLDFEPQAEGEEAGLTVMISNDHHYEVAVAMVNGKKHIIFRRRMGILTVVIAAIPCEFGPYVLGISSDCDFYTFTYSRPDGEEVEIGKGECKYLTTEVGGAFTGVYIGMYATGNGKKSTTPAYFDWFDYGPIERD